MITKVQMIHDAEVQMILALRRYSQSSPSHAPYSSCFLPLMFLIFTPTPLHYSWCRDILKMHFRLFTCPPRKAFLTPPLRSDIVLLFFPVIVSSSSPCNHLLLFLLWSSPPLLLVIVSSSSSCDRLLLFFLWSSPSFCGFSHPFQPFKCPIKHHFPLRSSCPTTLTLLPHFGFPWSTSSTNHCHLPIKTSFRFSTSPSRLPVVSLPPHQDFTPISDCSLPVVFYLPVSGTDYWFGELSFWTNGIYEP